MEQRPALEEKQGSRELDELLRTNVELQSQFDRKISQALSKARAGWEKEHGETSARIREAEEKAQEQERLLSQREAELSLRERKALARIALQEKGLPGDLESCLDLTDEESLNLSMASLETAFKRQVRKAVEDQLRGLPPKSSGHSSGHMGQIRAALGLK